MGRGLLNPPTSRRTPSPTSCGDGLLWEAMEECDDGNDVAYDGCSECVTESCGYELLPPFGDRVDFCVPPGMSAIQAACELGQGAPCMLVEAWGGSVWVAEDSEGSVNGYVESTVTCGDDSGSEYPAHPGQLVTGALAWPLCTYPFITTVIEFPG